LAGQPSPPAADSDQDSGEGIDAQITEALERVLAEKLGGLRQDLEGLVERRVQSFSDKTAHRLGEEQRQQLQMLDRLMEGLREQLGPDFDTIRTQKQLEILTGGQGQAPQMGQAPPQEEPQEEPQPTEARSMADAYLQSQGVSPQSLSAQEQAFLSQAQGWPQWFQRVGEVAQRRQAAKPPARQGGNPAAAQPMGMGRSRGTPSLEQLNQAYNQAVANGDLTAMRKLGAAIDAAIKQQGG
jgi:hypothetical protein